MNYPDRIQVAIRSSVHDDPFAGPGSRYSNELKQFLRVSESLGGTAIRPQVSMDRAELQTVLEFAAPLAHDALNTLAAALIAWIHGRPGRRTEVNGFGVTIRTNSVEDAKHLIEQMATFQKNIETGGEFG